MRKIAFTILALMVYASSGLASETGIVIKASKYSVAETLNRLEGVLKAGGMTIFARIDHSGEAAKVGLQMRPMQLLIFGNPRGGTPLMVASPTAAIDLPMKALAWEDTSGKVWLTYNAASYLKSRHDIKGRDELLKTLEGALDATTNKALE
jgi:YD repeat-containing protein